MDYNCPKCGPIFDVQNNLRKQNKILVYALESISKNSCCGDCQEAKRVALKVLKEVKQ